MSIAFPYYTKIKDRYCIVYAGYCEEYVFLLKHVRPALEQHFPELDIYLSCRDDYMYLLNGCTKTLSRSALRKQYKEFGYIRELHGKMNGLHPIHELFTESDIPVPTLGLPTKADAKLCYICPEGSLPTKSMKDSEIRRCEEMAQFKGYQVRVGVDGGLDQAGWVVGVESVPLFGAAINGRRTTLVPKGIGTKFYQALFPRGKTYSHE